MICGKSSVLISFASEQMVTHRSSVGFRIYGTCQVVLAVKLAVYQFFKPAIRVYIYTTSKN